MALAGRHTWHQIELASRWGCIAWPEPDVMGSWEVTDGLAKWRSFLVKGAIRLEVATNRCRPLRGELPAFFP
jgi:hypothetical protein